MVAKSSDNDEDSSNGSGEMSTTENHQYDRLEKVLGFPLFVSYRCSYQGFSYRSVLPVPVRQVIGTRTARYRAVPPKSTVDGRFNRRWLIEGEIDHRRSIEGEKGKKKKKKRRKKKEERRGEEERIPRIVLARASLPLAGCPSAAVALARRSPASRCRPRS
ncbi:hypothetical protein BHE74_00016959 [Ensete ventricosum]|nr:hypothetical protein BHE74_00016959 [Ensete ventricosum]